METPGFEMDHIVIRTMGPEGSGRFHALLLARLGFTKRRDHVFARGPLFLSDPDGLRIEVTCYADPGSDPVD